MVPKAKTATALRVVAISNFGSERRPFFGEIVGKSWENHRKIMGKSENHRKIQENHRKIQENHGKIGKSRKILGKSRKILEGHEVMEHENPRNTGEHSWKIAGNDVRKFVKIKEHFKHTGE